MRRLLALPGIPFFILGEACCFAIMFFRRIGGVGGERIKLNWSYDEKNEGLYYS